MSEVKKCPKCGGEMISEVLEWKCQKCGYSMCVEPQYCPQRKDRGKKGTDCE